MLARLALPLVLLAACSSAPTAPAGPPEMPQPTEQHRMLLKSVGTWEGTLTMSMPGVPAEPVPCREVVEAVGEFWTQSKFTCDMGGMAFSGTAAMGYEPDAGFVGTWIDSMTDRLVVMRGEMSKDGKLLVMRYMGPDPATGEMTPHRIETMWDANSYTSNFFHGEGDGVKSMVIAMKRKER